MNQKATSLYDGRKNNVSCMLTHSFCHFPGIGPKREKQFWRKGIRTWQDLLLKGEKDVLTRQDQHWQTLVEESIRQLERGNAEYFAGLLPRSEMWRLFGEFKDQTAYLDIETTGMGQGLDHITCIGLFDGSSVQSFVQGQNLEEFADRILEYKLLVTFNGACFDVPFIERELQIAMPAAHIDLRFLLKSLGYAGGLKSVERQFGLDRGCLSNADGYLAVLLWKRFEATAEKRVLETLLAYNAEDVINLEVLMAKAYQLKRAACALTADTVTDTCLDKSQPFPNPYCVHPEVLD